MHPTYKAKRVQLLYILFVLFLLVLDPESYCLEKLPGRMTLGDAEKECANYKTGWKVPVVTDLTMMERIEYVI